MNPGQATMYATDFDAGVGLGDILQACLDGANKAWEGEVKALFDEQARFRLSFVEGDTTIESCGLHVAVVDGRYRLITVEVEDMTGAGVCGWNMHCHANDTLNTAPSRPLIEAAAVRAYRAVEGRLIDLRELVSSR